ncbi:MULTISPECIES: ExbD/TolR family protein [Vibrio]|uniref:Biopolymer transporter ExbD n=2 Tax=Vibrio TaxID=662 RepID=A0A7X4LMY4_9VIBR|nr:MULTISPECIES: biopolymer transporter ExbD [Vibrio]MBF9000930.1 biopolymer transporter ExbD [Vibrio nitrifigilis]MZI94874.1 hypothetical protein [Vibrio eleionomae]
MIKNPALEEEQQASEPLTAMIDVIFTLIAFMMLMINAPLVGMDVKLPSTEQHAQSINVNPHTVTISVLKEKSVWFLDDAPLNSEQLKAKLTELKAAHPDTKVIVNSDNDVPMQRMVTLFTLMQSVPLDVTHIALKEAAK